MTNTWLVWRVCRDRNFRVAFDPSVFDVFENYWLIAFVVYALKTRPARTLGDAGGFGKFTH